MALIDCPECGKPVSSEAAACPSCGLPVREHFLKEAKLYIDAVELAMRNETITIAMLQRRLRIGYGRASDLIEQLVSSGIITIDENAPTRVYRVT